MKNARLPGRGLKPRPLPYLPALDGLRALAISAVLLYHAEPSWLPGGFLGVDVFFVISAYLITALLAGEQQAHGPIGLRAFWARRARRLLPAAFVLIGLTLAAAVLWLPAEVAGLRGAGLSAAVYGTNWYLIFSQQSYFESAGRPSLLRHLWSLAVEEQFYVLWPVLLLPLLRLRSRRLRVGIVIGGVVASTLWMAFLYQPGQDPSRVYYGTDTRAAALLVGAALALVWTPWRSMEPLSRTRAWLLSAAGVLALGALAAICLGVNEADARLYQGGLLVVALLSAVAIAAAAHAQGMCALGLARNPLRWIGLRSYSLYLWHWPVFLLTRPQLDVAWDGPPLLLLRLALTLALAELSYRLIEMPVRRGALGAAWQRLRGPQSRAARIACGGVSLAALVALVLLGRAVALARPPEPPAWLLAAQSETAGAAMLPVAWRSADDGAGTVAHARDTRGSAGATQAPDSHEWPRTLDTGASDMGAIVARRAGAPAWIPPADGLDDGQSRITTFAPNATFATPTDDVLDGSRPPEIPHSVLASATAMPADDMLDDASVAEIAAPRLDAVTATPGAAVAAPSPPPAQAVVSPPAVLPPVAPLLSPERAAEVTAIGDSVMLSAAGEMRHVLGAIAIDAQLGRHTATTIDLLRARRDANQLGAVVIIQTGDNGYLSVREMQTMLNLLGRVRRVVLVNLHVPREWERNNNDILRGESEGQPNVVLVDWSAASANHPEYFWDDGMHLRAYGARAYATLVAAAIQAP